MEVPQVRARGDELHGAWACDALLTGDLVAVGPGLGRPWVAVDLDPVGDAWRREALRAQLTGFSPEVRGRGSSPPIERRRICEMGEISEWGDRKSVV